MKLQSIVPENFRAALLLSGAQILGFSPTAILRQTTKEIDQ
jgi:hypothetical protein